VVALAAYDRIIGLELDELSVDGCITKAPCGGDKAGPSPVDRRKQGLKGCTATEAGGVGAGANPGLGVPVPACRQPRRGDVAVISRDRGKSRDRSPCVRHPSPSWPPGHCLLPANSCLPPPTGY